MIIKKIRNASDKELVNLVKEKYYYISFLKNPKDSLFYAAVCADGRALQFMKNQSDHVCIRAIEQDPNSLEFIKDQNSSYCFLAASKSLKSILKIRDKKKRSEIIEVLIKTNSRILKEADLLELSEKQINQSIINHPESIQYFKKQTYEHCLLALESHEESNVHLYIKLFEANSREEAFEVVNFNLRKKNLKSKIEAIN